MKYKQSITGRILVLTALVTALADCKKIHDGGGMLKAGSETQFIDSTDMTNNFYDNTETYSLAVRDLIIEGEITNPGKVDFAELPRHSVIVKEALSDSAGGGRFTGAFRYDGYSLFDILEERITKKSNAEEFSSVIDLFVEIENETGEKVVFSWGEIYYPNNLHKILIASNVSRIVPSRTKELWTLPEKSKVIAATDLITERNISDPVKITVRSYPRSFKTAKGMSPMYSPGFLMYDKGIRIGELSAVPDNTQSVTFNTIFYGRGRGIHSTSPFSGPLLKDILTPYYPASKEKLQKGIMCLTGKDGYRCAVSYSEVFNRNDRQEFLLVKSSPGEDGGIFRVFPAADFFSDRAIKSLCELHLNY